MKPFSRLPKEKLRKECLFCGDTFFKPVDWANKLWLNRKYCSRVCSAKKSIGHKVTLETREKIRTANTGQIGHIAWNRGIPNINMQGKNNPNWKGGITPINKAIRESLEYEEWRTKVFERDNYTCQECGKIGGYLQADHIKPFSLYPDLRFELTNGRTFCKPCHKKLGWELFRENNPRRCVAQA